MPLAGRRRPSLSVREAREDIHSIPLGRQHLAELVVGAANAVRRGFGVQDFEVDWSGEQAPFRQGIRQAAAGLETGVAGIPPDVVGALQVVGVETNPDAERYGLAATQVDWKQGSEECALVGDHHHDRAIRIGFGLPNAICALGIGKLQNRVRETETDVAIALVSRVSTDAAGCHAPYGGIVVALVRMNALTCRSSDDVRPCR